MIILGVTEEFYFGEIEVYKDHTGLNGSKSPARESHQKAVLVGQEKDLLIFKKISEMHFGIKLITSKCLGLLCEGEPVLWKLELTRFSQPLSSESHLNHLQSLQLSPGDRRWEPRSWCVAFMIRP